MTRSEKTEAKLRDLGIETDNYYPKTTFMKDGAPYVGLYLREMNEDFYFLNQYNKLYKFPKTNDLEKYDMEKFGNGYKYQIPVSDCKLMWEDKPLVEKPDKSYKDMTLREYACLMLRVPESGTDWLDTLIKNAPLPEIKVKKKKKQSFGPM